MYYRVYVLIHAAHAAVANMAAARSSKEQWAGFLRRLVQDGDVGVIILAQCSARAPVGQQQQQREPVDSRRSDSGQYVYSTYRSTVHTYYSNATCTLGTEEF